LLTRLKRRSAKHVYDANDLEATKAYDGPTAGVSGAADAPSPIFDKNESCPTTYSCRDDNHDEEAALKSSPMALKSTTMAIPSPSSSLPGAPKEVMELQETTKHRKPGLGLVTRLIILADFLVGIRLVETYGSDLDAAVIPHRLKHYRFEWAEYTLHPALSWDDIAAILMNDQVG
jgi:hypothetical protein